VDVGVDIGLGVDTCVGVDTGLGVDAGVGVDAGLGVDTGTGVDSGVGVDEYAGVDTGLGVDTGTGVDAIATTLVGTGVDDPVKVGVVLSAAGVCTMAGPDVCGIDGVFGGVGTCAVNLPVLVKIWYINRLRFCFFRYSGISRCNTWHRFSRNRNRRHNSGVFRSIGDGEFANVYFAKNLGDA